MWCLRLILLFTRPRSWIEARSSPDGILQISFKEAAKSHGLVTDDNIPELTLREAIFQHHVTAYHLRKLYVTILRFNSSATLDALGLLNMFFADLTSDYPDNPP